MHDISTNILGRLRQKRNLRQWERLAGVASTAGEKKLRTLRRMSLELGERVSAVKRTSETRLAQLSQSGKQLDFPPATDWWHRPDVMSGPIQPPGAAPAKSETRIGKDVTLYHDCRTPCLAVRQERETGDNPRTVFSLKLDVFEFDGSFLSFVIQPPAQAVEGLLKSHLLRLSLSSQSEQPVEINARLNLKHGPNTEQVSHDIACDPAGTTTDFDLAYMPFNEGRAEQIWVDIFLQTPPMNLITITDITLSRHLRATL